LNRRPTYGEGYVVKASNAAAEKAGFIHRKVRYENRNGAPDDWYFGPGARLIIIEHKRPGKDATAQQKREGDRLRKLGFDVRVVDTVEMAQRVFRDEDLL